MLPVSLVILSHNRLEEITHNLPLLLSGRHGQDEFEIIVVDNGSTDGSSQFLGEFQSRNRNVKVILNEKNQGVAGGRNIGFAAASRDYILALDDDSRFDLDSIRKIPSIFEAHNDWGVLAFRVIHAISGDPQTLHGEVSHAVANHHGAGFAFRRRLYTELGGIDPDCNFGAEELDFAIRVYDHGFKVQYIPDIVVYHNSLIRAKDTDQYRRIRRVYNNVRIYYKFFPTWMANRNGFRYFVTAARSWIACYGITSIRELLVAYSTGRKAGLAGHVPVSERTASFYNDPALRPSFGNVPLTWKAIRFAKNWRLHHMHKLKRKRL